MKLTFFVCLFAVGFFAGPQYLATPLARWKTVNDVTGKTGSS
jgi:hypothetical protein